MRCNNTEAFEIQSEKLWGKKALVTIRNTHSKWEDLEKIELEIEIIQFVRSESKVSRIEPGAGGVGGTNRRR